MEKYFTPIFLMLVALYFKDSDSLAGQILRIAASLGALVKGIPMAIESFDISNFFAVEKVETKPDNDKEVKSE